MSTVCGVRGLVPGQRLEQLGRAGHRERQDQPVRLRQGQRPFGGLVRRALVTELAVGEPGQQLRLDDRGVSDDRCRAIENIVQHAQGSGRIAVREADHRAGITDLTGAGPLVIEGRQQGTGLAEQPARAWVAAIQPATWLASACDPASCGRCGS